jgi:hypothetical protein
LLASACERPGASGVNEATHPTRTWYQAGTDIPREVVSPYPVIHTCPTILDQVERINRVIGRACGPVKVTRGYRLDAGSLTLDAGTQLWFEPGAALIIGQEDEDASLHIRGTEARPVVLTMAEDARAPGAWEGVRLYSGATDSTLRHVVIEYAGHRERTALYIEATGVEVEHATLREIAGTGVHVSGEGRLARFDHNTLARVRSPVVMLMPPDSTAALGEHNTFPEGARIRLLRGIVRRGGRWPNLGIPYVVTDVIDIAGTDEESALVELAPGARLEFEANGYINVGYYNPGELRAIGTADAPIVFTAAGAREPGAWKGVMFYRHAVARLEHVVMEYGGRYVDRGVLFANGHAALSVEHVLFRHNLADAVLYDDELVIEAFANNQFESGARPLTLSPRVFGQIAASNHMAGGVITVKGGTVAHDTRWRALNEVPVELLGDIQISAGATLTVDPGTRVRIRDGVKIAVGEALAEGAHKPRGHEHTLDHSGALVMKGTAAAPILFHGQDAGRATWGPIVLRETARASTFQHVQFTDASGPAAIEVQDGASAHLESVSCARCAGAVVTWGCRAEVKHEQLKALEGTPASARPPTGCAPGVSSRQLERMGEG